MAYSGGGSVELGAHCTIDARVQTWRDSDGWLENQYAINLRYDIARWLEDTTVVFGFEATEFNLSVYTPADAEDPALPILPWDHDEFFKLALEKHW